MRPLHHAFLDELEKIAMAKASISSKAHRLKSGAKAKGWNHMQQRISTRASRRGQYLDKDDANVALARLREALTAPGGPRKDLGEGDFLLPLVLDGKVQGNFLLEDMAKKNGDARHFWGRRGHEVVTFLSPDMSSTGRPLHLSALSKPERDQMKDLMRRVADVMDRGRPL
jgi:hypothetical protein